MRICLMYDCLYPWTVGGGERWYRGIAERLAADGHEVTYLTRLQWPRDQPPQIPGVRVVAIGRRQLELYDGERRKMWPPLRFGWGALVHLLRHGGKYDVVHTSSFPFFSLLAAGVARRVHRFQLTADWFEVWTDDYWDSYVGGLGGKIGVRVQRACSRVNHLALVFSALHERRLRALAPKLEVERFSGMYPGSLAPPVVEDPPAAPLVVYAGRHTQEKRVPSLPAAIAEARKTLPELTGVILGDGPHRDQVIAEVARLGLEDVVRVPGFVETAELERLMHGASCVVQPSEREGYGMVVVESASRGVPVVVVRGDDNAAVELVEPGVNGEVAESTQPAELGAAIVRACAGGRALRDSTAAWFNAHAERLSVDDSLHRLEARYGAAGA